MTTIDRVSVRKTGKIWTKKTPRKPEIYGKGDVETWSFVACATQRYFKTLKLRKQQRKSSFGYRGFRRSTKREGVFLPFSPKKGKDGMKARPRRRCSEYRSRKLPLRWAVHRFLLALVVRRYSYMCGWDRRRGERKRGVVESWGNVGVCRQ